MKHSWARLITAPLLGLPAALLAHAVVFGHGHVAGGSLHGIVLALAGSLAFFGLLISATALLRRIPGATPGIASIAACSALWLTAIERAEQPHALPILTMAAALLLAAAAVRLFATVFSRIVCAIAAIIAAPFRNRLPRALFLRADAIPRARSAALLFYLFSRPPPALV